MILYTCPFFAAHFLPRWVVRRHRWSRFRGRLQAGHRRVSRSTARRISGGHGSSPQRRQNSSCKHRRWRASASCPRDTRRLMRIPGGAAPRLHRSALALSQVTTFPRARAPYTSIVGPTICTSVTQLLLPRTFHSLMSAWVCSRGCSTRHRLQDVLDRGLRIRAVVGQPAGRLLHEQTRIRPPAGLYVAKKVLTVLRTFPETGSTPPPASPWAGRHAWPNGSASCRTWAAALDPAAVLPGARGASSTGPRLAASGPPVPPAPGGLRCAGRRFENGPLRVPTIVGHPDRHGAVVEVRANQSMRAAASSSLV